jgi:hypothetical protein
VVRQARLPVSRKQVRFFRNRVDIVGQSQRHHVRLEPVDQRAHPGVAEAGRAQAGAPFQTAVDQDPMGVDLDHSLYALDSTTIDLCLTLFPWARFRQHKGAVKMHTRLDLHGNIPTFIHIAPRPRIFISGCCVRAGKEP